MFKFAFIAHPIDLKQIRELVPLKFLPDFILRKSLRFVKPFVASTVKNVVSISGKQVEGYVIVCPLLPKQILDFNQEFVLSRIIEACRLGEKLGAKIVGLGGYTSVIGDKGTTIAKNVNIAVTTGNSYTAASILELLFQIAKEKNLDLTKSRAAIIGATGSIGNACARYLAEYVQDIVITARHTDKLEELKQNIENISKAKVEINLDARGAVKEADIVIVTTSAPDALLDVADLKAGAIACDVSVPKNISGRNSNRKDVIVFDGGLIKTPSNVKVTINTGLPEGVLYGCISETIILALEEGFENFSLGNNLSLDKITEISEMAKNTGFTL